MISKIRALIMRLFRPAGLYWLARPSAKPLSHKFGFDRGNPIDRYWIEKFLTANKKLITGRCLEVTDSFYTIKFGLKVTKSDVLDINPKNKLATIHGDLKHLTTVKSNTYDCLILTHVLGLIDDVQAAACECHRILKPGGVLLFTSSCNRSSRRHEYPSLSLALVRLCSPHRLGTYSCHCTSQF